MLIILEGPDGAGKTTRARLLADHLEQRMPRDRVRILHKGPPTSPPLEEYVRPLLDYRPGRGEHIICDRWHLGELVYPQLLGRPTTYGLAEHRYVEAFLRSRGAFVEGHFFDAPVLYGRLTRRGDDLLGKVTLGQVERMCDAWQYAFTQTSLPVHYMPVSLFNLVEYALAQEMSADLWSNRGNTTTFVGWPWPLTLLVGDVRGRFDWPLAFVPERGTSGHWLFSHLNPYDHGFVNANDVDDVEKLARTVEEHERLAPLGEASMRWVALGRKASRRLTDAGIKHGVVPHPQFVRRFYHYSGHAYADLIRAVAVSGEDAGSWPH